MGAGGVAAARLENLRAGGGASPTPALHQLVLAPIPLVMAKILLVLNHYLHSLPGGTALAFGVFLEGRLLGVITFGAGPANAHRLVEGATQDDCLVLTRLWLSDKLPRNSESKVIGMALRALKRLTPLKFLITYADPSQGHVGTIYQASNWIYTGLSEATPLYRLGDGPASHSRSFSHKLGTRSTEYFAARGIQVTRIPQSPKHRYVFFLDRSWRNKLTVPPLPYPRTISKGGKS